MNRLAVASHLRLPDSALPGWLPLAALPIAVILTLHSAEPWLFMWALAGAIFAGFKWLTWWRVVQARGPASPTRSLAYLLLWPGMDAAAFLNPADRPAAPSLNEWSAAVLKTVLGAMLFWGLARFATPASELAAGWIGLFGLIFLLHFGSFHLVSLTWRAMGIQARPIMDVPLAAASPGDLWGRRWNLAFHVLGRDLVAAAVRRRFGTIVATLLTFLVSGLIHDLVISVPARGGYGLPTAYFLLQGIGVLVERSPIGIRRGPWARVYVFAVAGLPAFWLFHPAFVLRVIVPFMRAFGAI